MTIGDFLAKFGEPIAQGGIAIAALVIALLVYQLRRQSLEDAWVEKFSQLHQQLWSETDMHKVRAWLANDSAYPELKAVLEKRQQQLYSKKPISMTEEEFAILDLLDRFVHHNIYCMGVLNLRRNRSARGKSLWARLFANYYLTKLVRPDDKKYDDLPRPHVAWYVETFNDDFHEELKNYFDENGIDMMPHLRQVTDATEDDENQES